MAFPLVFDPRIHTIFMVSDAGKVDEMKTEHQKRFAGRHFRGDPNYSGKYLEEVKKISGAWMFIKKDDFIAQAGFETDELPPSKKDVLKKLQSSVIANWIESVIIVERSL